MLSYEAALERLLAAIPGPTSDQEVAVAVAAGRYLAAPPAARVALPPFDNSAMDGWAVRSADIRSVPARLRMVGRVAAGETWDGVIRAGEAVRVFTGSPLPTGADAVIMQEDSRWDPQQPTWVEFTDTAKPWENVRIRGEDCPCGAAMAEVGTRLGAAQLTYFHAAGVDHIRVYPPVTVAIVPNGSELVSPGTPLPPGCIYESNSIALATLLQAAGAQPSISSTPADEPTAIREALRRAFQEADLVVTAGGASVGDADLIKPSFEALGGTLDFWRVGMKPGKPFFLGRLGEGRGAKFLLGVPGNPVSAFVTTVLLVLPAVRRRMGAAAPAPTVQPGRLLEPLTNPEGRRHWMRVQCDSQGGVRSSGAQRSHFLSSLARSNGLVDVPPQTQWPAGTEVPVVRWER